MSRPRIAAWGSVDASALLIFVIKISGAVAYALAFDGAYDAYLPRYWSEWGFVLYNKPTSDVILAVLVAAGPALWLPSVNDRPSTLFQWVTFIVVYVPTIIVAYKITPQIDASTYQLWLDLFSGFAILSLVTRTAPISINRIVMPGAQSTVLLLGFGFALLIVTLVAYGSAINVFAFDDIYKQRAAAGELQISGLPVYAYSWLSNALLPLGLVWALHKRNWALFALCFVGEILMFGVGAAKLAGLTAFAVPLLYVFGGMFRRSFGAVMVVAAASAVGLAGSVANGHADRIGLAVSVLLGRMLGVPGLVTVQYFRFFQTNPLTYWSHVNIVGWLIPYPYAQSLPYLFGHRLYGLDFLSWNANFWATDGFAALGGVGVIIISALTGLTLRLLDQACRHLEARITAAWSLPAAMALSNIGLFTAIATNGIGLMILTALLLPAARRSIPLTALRPLRGRTWSFGDSH